MKLSNKLEICRIDSYSHGRFIDMNKAYIFRYAKNYRLKLEVALDTIGYLPGDYIPVLNFGYSLEVEELHRRYMTFRSIYGLDCQNGYSTKHIIGDKESRKILFGFVKKAFSSYLKRAAPPIIIRGPITAFKKSNYRYEDITNILFLFGYELTVIKAIDMRCKPNDFFMEDEEMDEYWFFTKKNIEIDKLKNITTEM